eukprot:646417-Amphidinium_carterae.2
MQALRFQASASWYRQTTLRKPNTSEEQIEQWLNRNRELHKQCSNCILIRNHQAQDDTRTPVTVS